MSTPRTIWLIRHGQRLDFVDPAWLKTAPRPHDAPLAPDGITQAREVGRWLAGQGIAHFFASPFLRGAETGSLIAQAIGRPVKIEPGLCEALYPQWFPVNPDFLPTDELARRFPHIDKSYQPAVRPGWPETPEAMQDRAARTIHALLPRFDGNLALVGHGASVCAIAWALAGGGAVHTPCCCLVKLVSQSGQWTIERDGRDVSHLSVSESQVRLA